MKSSKKIISYILCILLIMSFVPQAIASDEIVINGADFDRSLSSSGVNEEWGTGNFTVSSSPAYVVEISESGAYKIELELAVLLQYKAYATVYVNDVPIGEREYQTSTNSSQNGYSVFKTFDAGVASFKEGTNIIKFVPNTTKSPNGCAIRCKTVTIKKVEAAKISSVKIGSEEWEENGVYKKGTDVLSVLFSDEISKNNGESVILTDEEGNELDVKVKYSEDKKAINILLCESLNYGKSYSLRVENVKDRYGSEVENKEFEFSVISEDEEDDGEDFAEISEYKIVDDTAYIKGIVKSSQSVGISGRCVEITIVDPNGNEIIKETVSSGKNGELDAKCELLGMLDAGDYILKVNSEYGKSPSEKSYFYIPTYIGNVIWQEIKNSQTADDVLRVLKENSSNLNINPEKDLEEFENAEDILLSLAGLDIENAEEFYKFYYGGMVLEKLNTMTADDVVEAIFQNDNYLNALEIEKDKLNLISDINKIYSDIFSGKPYEDVESVKSQFEISFSSLYKEENNISDITLMDAAVTGNKGESINVAVNSNEFADNIKEIELTVTFDARMENYIENFEASSIYGSAKVQKDGYSYKIKVSDIETASIKELVRLSYNSLKTGNAGFDIEGYAVCNIGEGYYINLNIVKNQFDVMVNPAKTTDGDVVLWGKDFDSISSEYYTIYGNDVAFLSNGIPTYNVNIAKDGIYEIEVEAAVSGTFEVPATVYVNGKGLGSVTYYTADGGQSGYDTFKKFEAGTALLSKGANTVKIQFDKSMISDCVMRLMSITLKPKGESELLSFKVGNTECSDRTVYKRGTDYFKAYYTSEIDIDSFDKIVIKDSEEKELSYSVSYGETKKCIVISLKDTLDYEEIYTVNLKGVKDIFEANLAEEIFTFKTGDANGDEGCDNAEITSFEIKNGIAYVSGVIRGETNEVISGRKVSVDIIAPNGTTYKASGESMENGIFNVTKEIVNADYGYYSSKALSEYGNVSEITKVYYIPESVTNEIFKAIKNASKDEAPDILDDNKEILNIFPAIDTSGVADKSLIYAHIAGKDIADYEEFIKIYYSAIALEKINQTDEDALSVAEQFFANEKYLASLDVDKEKLDVIVEKSELYSEILKAERVETLKAFNDVFDEAFNKVLKKQASLKDVDLVTKSDVAYVGQKLEYDIVAEHPFKNAKEIELKFNFGQEVLYFDIKSDFGKVNISNKGNVYNVKITDVDKNAEIEKIALVSFGINEEGSKTFDVSGSILSDSSTAFDVICEINSQSYTANVNKVKSPGKDSGGSGGSSGSKITSSEVVPPKDTVEALDGADYRFSDLDSVKWAESDIYTLLNRQVLSMPEDKLFNPNRNITRAEFAKMLVLAFDLWISPEVKFEAVDVEKDSWYYGYISAAYSQGVMTGDGEGLFMPNSYITREDMCVMLSRVAKTASSETDDKFLDDENISEYAKKAVYGMKKAGMIDGMGDNKFEPKLGATRAQAAKIVCRALIGG